METSQSIVELVDIALNGRAGRTIFDALNFNLPEGQTAIIAGPTGSGKTQLVKLLIGELKPDRGGIIVFGEIVKIGQQWRLAKMRRKIGGVGGVFGLISDQSVFENLLHPLILTRGTKSFQKAKVEQILERFELGMKRKEKAGNLSQGEKIEVMLARAIIADQPLLLIDEPLAGVDESMSAKIRELLSRLSMAGHSMIVLTSNPEKFNIHGSKTYTLIDGKLI